MPFGRAGVLGQASLLADCAGQLAKSLAWGRVACGATERAHKRNGGQVAAEWRWRSLVTNFGFVLFDDFV